MVDKNIQMTQRNATNDAWDNLNPKTKAANVFMADAASVEDIVTAHLADNVKHITAAERTAWNAKLDASNAASIAGKIYAYNNIGGAF